jgi:hypothetical protein
MKFFKLKKKKKFSRAISQNYLFTKTKKKKKRILLNLFYLVLIFLVIGLGFYILFFLQYFQIKNVSFDGMVTVGEGDLKNIFSEYASEKRYFLENSNIFVLSSSGLSERIEKSFRRVKGVDVKKDFPDSLKINLEEYKPIGISCKETDGKKDVKKLKKAECFYFDKDGIIFDSAPLTVGSLLVFLYDKNINIKSFPDNSYKKESVDFILKLKSEILKKIGISVDYFKFLNEYDDIEAVSKSGFKMFFTQDQDPLLQVEAIKELIESTIKDDIINLDYIDLRIQNRAYYKLKTIDTATTTEQVLGDGTVIAPKEVKTLPEN